MRERKDAVSIMILGTVVVAFFFPGLHGGRMFLPLDTIYQTYPWRAQFAGPAPSRTAHGMDGLRIFLPYSKFFKDSISHGEFPLWNPYIFLGVPYFDNIQTSALNPFNALFLFFSLPLAYTLMQALHVFLIGLFMYLLLRRLSLQALSSFLGAVISMLNPFCLMSSFEKVVLSVAVWIPLVIIFILNYTKTERIFWGALASIVIFIQIFSGHTETLFYAYILYGLFAVYGTGFSLLRHNRIVLFKMILFLLLPIMAAAPYFVSLAGLLSSSNRTIVSIWGTNESFPPWHLITSLFPRIFGRFDYSDNYANHLSLFYGPAGFAAIIKKIILFTLSRYEPNYWSCSYIGIAPLFFLVIFIFFSERSRNNSFFKLSLLVVFLWAISGPVYGIVFRWVPLFNKMKTPVRAMMLVYFFAALGSAFGFEAYCGDLTVKGDLLMRRRSERIIVMFLAVSAVAFLCVWWLGAIAEKVVSSSGAISSQVLLDDAAWYRDHFRGIAPGFITQLLILALLALALLSRFSCKRYQGYLLVFISVLDLFLFAKQSFSATDSRRLLTPTPGIRFLEKDRSLYRVTALSDEAKSGPWYSDIFEPNLMILFNLQDIRGFDSIYPERTKEYCAAVSKSGFGRGHHRVLFFTHAYDLKLLGMANVKYIATSPLSAVSDRRLTLVYSGKDMKLFENTIALPRAYIVHDFKVIKGRNNIFNAFTGSNFDPRNEIILEEHPGLSGSSAAVQRGPDNARVVEYKANQVKIEADLARPGFVVLTDQDYPGWHAYVDGSKDPVKILTANYVFRAIPLFRGRHTVLIRYEPHSFSYGLPVTGALFLMVLCAGLVKNIRNVTPPGA